MLSADTVLQGRYRIIRQLGQGGMGTVYEALALRLDTTVAIKETHFTEERLRKQFEREAQLLARLRHPALPRVIDHFEENDGVFLVMDYIPGEDFGEMLLRKSRPFSFDEVLRWGDQLLDALDYLHLQNPPVIHRDIKPQNLKLTSRNQIILLDFGLAKGFAGQISRVTTSGSLFGFTPNYAPLEQIQGTGTGPRSDLYSLSATLYHLMTNMTPPDVLTRLTETTNGQPDPLAYAHEVNAQVPPAVAGVLHQAMAIGSNQRFASADEMRNALRKVSQPPAYISSSEAKTELFTPPPPTIVSHTSSQYSPDNTPRPTVASPIQYQSVQAYRPTVTPQFGQSAPPTQIYSIPPAYNQPSFQPPPAHATARRSRLWIPALGVCLLLVAGVSVFAFWNQLSTAVSEQIRDASFASTETKAEDDVQAHIKKGDDYYDKRELEKAIEEYTKAIELDPKNAEAYRGRGNSYRRLFKDTEALADLNKAIQLNPKDSTAYRGRGSTYAGMRRYELAIADYNKAIELDPKNSDAYASRGNVYQSMSKFPQAIADYNKAIELDPKNSDAYANRGFYYLKRGKFTQSLADLNKAVELEPKNSRSYINRAAFYVDTRKYDLGIADANQAIQLGSKDPSAYNNRGLAYAYKGDYDRAIEDYTEAIRLDPDYVYAYQNRSIAYTRKGRRDLAKADDAQAKRINAQHK